MKRIQSNSITKNPTALLEGAATDHISDRSGYLRSTEDLVWTGAELQFTQDIVLELINTKSGTLTQHTIQLADSPISLANGEILYAAIDRTNTSETITLINSGATPVPAQTSVNKDIIIFFKRIDESGSANLYIPFLKQSVREGQSFKLGASGGGGLGTKSIYLDPLSSTLPTGTSVTIDGITGVNGDTVLFTNLSSNNNRIYELGGVGVALTWTAIRAFNSQFDPTDGDFVRVLKGDSFAEQLAIFNNVDFLVNDIVRHFDGVSGDFWEQSSIKTTTIANNTTGNIFSVNVTGSENIIVDYSVVRGSTKETGRIVITSDGTSAALTRTNAYLSDIGVIFDAIINTGNLELNFTSDDSSAGTMKYSIKRWSNSAGGPTGIPSYSGATGATTPAAGSLNEVQFHGSSGNLDADSRFKWDPTAGAIDLNGLKYLSLSASITINDNQAAPLSIINYSNSNFNYAIIEYSVTRNGIFRTGRFLIANNATTTVAFSDDFVETSGIGVTFSVTNGGGLVNINYTSTSTGFAGTFKFTIRKWT